jgi:hypothetical protein
MNTTILEPAAAVAVVVITVVVDDPAAVRPSVTWSIAIAI